MSSILTHNSAMDAQQQNKSINMDLSKTQNEISTGKSISSASDNASMWAISKVMEADVAGFSAISKSLALGESTVAVAAAGADKIVVYPFVSGIDSTFDICGFLHHLIQCLDHLGVR